MVNYLIVRDQLKLLDLKKDQQENKIKTDLCQIGLD